MFLSFFNTALKQMKTPVYSIADIAFMQTSVTLPIKKHKHLIQTFQNGKYVRKIIYLSERKQNGTNKID